MSTLLSFKYCIRDESCGEGSLYDGIQTFNKQFSKMKNNVPNKIVWWTPLLYYILINYDFLSKLFDSGYIRQFLFIVIMIACVRKVRLVAFRRYFKIFLKVKISKKNFEKNFFGNFWKFFFENFSKKKIGLNFLENLFWKIFKKIFEKKNSKISKKNFLEIVFWKVLFRLDHVKIHLKYYDTTPEFSKEKKSSRFSVWHLGSISSL